MTEDSVPDDDAAPKPVRAPTTGGGEGRLTVAVTRTDVQPLLRANTVQVVVESRGTRREYEVVSMLRRADRQFRRLSVRAGNAFAGQTIAGAGLREAYGVAVLAVRKTGGWSVAPAATTRLEDGDDVLAVGDRDDVERLADAMTRASTPRGDD
jgi:uncharacterized protein with PhoU and TrkA domain